MSGLLVAGTTSDAGKSAVTAGLCRALARRGVRVAPFKAQNMSNNSMVCRGPDGTGVEIGRAQWVQALAARTTPEAAMNPVLLKPASDHRSHVVLMGKPWGEVASSSWCAGRRALAEAACRAFDALAARYDVVVAEGAGSPAEINLRAGDYVNMGLARHAGLPTIVSVTSTAAGCSLRSWAPSRCWLPRTRRWSRGLWSISFGATPTCWRQVCATWNGSPGAGCTAPCRGTPTSGWTPKMPSTYRAGARRAPGPAG